MNWKSEYSASGLTVQFEGTGSESKIRTIESVMLQS